MGLHEDAQLAITSNPPAPPLRHPMQARRPLLTWRTSGSARSRHSSSSSRARRRAACT